MDHDQADTPVDTIEAEAEEMGLATQPVPPALFGTPDDPEHTVELMTRHAKALAGIIETQKLYKQIRSKRHILVEGWTTLGAMVGVFPVTVWTKELANGWEARVEARTLSGQIVGAAEAMCTHDEKPGTGGSTNQWKNADEYALRSMAQTRATSKALRMPLGFIVTLAGFDSTPADEMGSDMGGDYEATPEVVRLGVNAVKVKLTQDLPVDVTTGQISKWWLDEGEFEFSKRADDNGLINEAQAADLVELARVMLRKKGPNDDSKGGGG